MTPEEARERLRFHTGPDDGSFLAMLRPYRGLREELFHDVMACIEALAGELGRDSIDRDPVASLWGICHLGRAWGLHPDGMLRRNDLIVADDVERLEGWIDCISYATFVLLDGGDLEAALEPYRAREVAG